tara:strand:- start:750 stop:1187 length:438 start_codon:yes stop_codon:yes gene_type:complete
MTDMLYSEWLTISLLSINFFVLYKVNNSNKKVVTSLKKNLNENLRGIYTKLEILHLNSEKTNLTVNYIESYIKNEFEREELDKLDRILGNTSENEYQKQMRICNTKIQMYNGRIEDLEEELKTYALENELRMDDLVYRKYASKYS